MAKNTPNYADANNLQNRQVKAMEEARRRLEAEGIEYPLFDTKLTSSDNYGRLLAYAEQESAMIVEIMREPVNPRPLVIDNVQPKEHFASCYDK